MEVSAEAKRIMVVALGKLYSSRSQRGGLRLHRSLLLTMVMKSARDMYHAAQTADWEAPGPCELQQPQQQQQQQQQQQPTTTAVTTEPAGPHVGLQGPASLASGCGGGPPRTAPRQEVVGPRAEDKENRCPSGPAQLSRKRRGKAADEPDFLPRKKAKLEPRANCSHHSVPASPASPALMDYVNCGELGSRPTPIPLQRAVAAC